jgi:hypothetical protein
LKDRWIGFCDTRHCRATHLERRTRVDGFMFKPSLPTCNATRVFSFADHFPRVTVSDWRFPNRTASCPYPQKLVNHIRYLVNLGWFGRGLLHLVDSSEILEIWCDREMAGRSDPTKSQLNQFSNCSMVPMPSNKLESNLIWCHRARFSFFRVPHGLTDVCAKYLQGATRMLLRYDDPKTNYSKSRLSCWRLFISR